VTIDWADEEVPEDVSPDVAGLLDRVRRSIEEELKISDAAERMRHGFEVAILGAPNTGKSSLLNYLAGREAAITSPHPGTTRDVIELRYDLRGLPVIFLDTAGLRATDDPVESIGVARASERARGADLRLFLRSADAPGGVWEERLFQPGDLRVWAKTDLTPGTADVRISTLTGSGLAALLECIEARLRARFETGGLVSHQRQRNALSEAAAALHRSIDGVAGSEAELIAVEIRSAMLALERMIGRTGTEDILGAVFAGFCLGK